LEPGLERSGRGHASSLGTVLKEIVIYVAVVRIQLLNSSLMILLEVVFSLMAWINHFGGSATSQLVAGAVDSRPISFYLVPSHVQYI
jgi:hypothetical protein